MADSSDLCIVFADLSGSTRLYERLGDAAALATVERCLNTLKGAVRIHKGRVVKTIGDEIMAAFDDAARGMHAAQEMQQRIEELPSPAQGIALAIRIGFAFGPALTENGDVFGDTVNTAARMAGLAKAGQILTTADTVAALPDFLHTACRKMDVLTVKGKAEDICVCEVLWQEGADLTMLGGLSAPSAMPVARLHLTHGDTAHLLGPDDTALGLGRDPASHLVIRDPRASRSHARIERRRDKFVLIDMSSNGTFVTIDGEAELMLKREELILRGRGRVVFGHAWGQDTTEWVEFSVESTAH